MINTEYLSHFYYLFAIKLTDNIAINVVMRRRKSNLTGPSHEQAVDENVQPVSLATRN